MAEASLLHVAESLLGKLAPYAFEGIKSWWGAMDDLQGLVSSIRIIKAGLLDAEKRQEGRDREGQLVKEWLRRLRYVLYDADDLFDEIITIEGSKQSLSGKEKFARELCQFFSMSNPALFLADIARKIKKIRKELDCVKSDMGHFTFDHGLSEKAVCFEREAGSVKAADDIIGREEDEEELMGLLLDDTSKEEGLADVIAIVGFGGLGKTTVAQLLYNNEFVKAKFELRSWACISDTKGTKSKARIILDALQTTERLGSSQWAFGVRNVHEISVNELELEIHRRIQNKVYLLVIDDFWDDDPQTWFYLKGLLRGGKPGSKILVTTRSSKVSVAMGVGAPHDLKGLADGKAWELFKRLAFRSVADAENQSLIMIGKEIVRKCKNVPLAIKAIASLLYTFHNNERDWKSIMDTDMLTLGQKHESFKVLPILKLSYDHLPSHLKHCFAFCSVFPKDYKMNGERLVFHWIAQGYIEQGYGGGQFGLVQIGEGYLKELTSRSFLEEDCSIKPRDRYGVYLMHDLMHDLAREVAGEEVIHAESSENRPNIIEHIGKTKNSNHVFKDVRIRHLSSFIARDLQNDYHFRSLETAKTSKLQSMKRAKYLRSIISDYEISGTAYRVLSSLRLLDMKFMAIESLSSSVGKLKHLRCLIISNNCFTHLPDEICKLRNLKILDVSWCMLLETLPRDFNTLINLTCLRIEKCGSFTGMPCKFGALSSLESLDKFIIGVSSREYSGFEELAGLVNLIGETLDVWFLEGTGGAMRKEDDKKIVDLSSSLVHLDSLCLQWAEGSVWEEGVEFQCSQLPSNLKRLDVFNFPGQMLPEWKAFNNLMEVKLHGCSCRYLPSFGEQSRIKLLELASLDELEYVQMEESDEFATETQYFPCLEGLQLAHLPKLKAWSPAMEKLAHQLISSSPLDVDAAFPRIHSLHWLNIVECPELMLVPLPLKYEGVRVSRAFRQPLKMLVEEYVNRFDCYWI